MSELRVKMESYRMIKAYVFLLTLFAGGWVFADDLFINSGIIKNQLVELYTSEGCSSCPPADQWISKLKDSDGLWEEVIPIAFHVDYWDQLGWKDQLARKEFSDRQRQYRSEGQISQVYTPGFVVNGQEWRGFFTRKLLKRGDSANVGELTLEVKPDTILASFTPQEDNNTELIFHLAILGFDISNQIQAGENSGKTLNHDFAVIGYHQQMVSPRNKVFVTDMNLPELAISAKKKAIVMWVSQSDSQSPIQAAGNWL